MPKSFSERCVELDCARQDRAGWGRGAWVGINYAKPKTDLERQALAIVEEHFPRAITVHVYTLVDFVRDLLEKEAADHEA